MTTLPATPSEASGQHTEAQTPWETLVEKLRELLSYGATGTFSFIGSNFGQIDVDLKSRTYTSAGPLNELPVDPEDVATRHIEEPSTHENPLNALLWELGELAYGDAVPSWLSTQASFGLERWPSFHGFAPTAIEIRLISMLTSNKLTFRELASATSVTQAEAQRLVSKLSLLDLLAVEQREVEPQKPIRVVTGRPGLPTQRPGGSKMPVTTLRQRSDAPELVEPVSVFDVAKRHRAELGDALPELDLELVTDESKLELPELPEVASDSTPYKPDVAPSAADETAQEQLTSPAHEPVTFEETTLTSEPEVNTAVEPELLTETSRAEHEPNEAIEEPTVSAHLFPAFNPSAPPPPIKRREPIVRNPNVKLEGSFKSLIEGKKESDESKENQDGGFLGRFLGRGRKG